MIKQTKLGKTDITVSEIALGGGNFGRRRVDLDCSETQVHRWLDRATDYGINFFDLADCYPGPTCPENVGVAEGIVGRWLQHQDRSKVVIATKIQGPNRPGVEEKWIRNGSRDITTQDLFNACDASLKRLGTDYIDLYQIHWPVRSSPAFGCIPFDRKDPEHMTSIHEQMVAMNVLIQQGKIRAYGLANETPYGVHEFTALARQHGLQPPATVQNQYSLNDRSVENGLHETTWRLGVSIMGYSALGFGLLTGKYDTDKTSPQNRDTGRMSHNNPGYLENKRRNWASQATFEASYRYNQLARKYGLTPTQMALAFCYQSPWTAVTIVGATNLEQLDENVQAYDVKLTNELLKEIDRVRAEIRDPSY